MSPRLQSVLRVFAGLAIVCSSGVVYGQFGRPVGPAAAKPAEPEPFSGKGKVQGVMPDMKGGFIVIMLLPEKNELWGLKIGKATKIRIKGKAAPDFLRSGLNVQFNAMVDKKASKLKDPVKKLTIFTESNEFTLGLFPDVGGPTAAGGEVAGDYKPYIVAGRVSSAKGDDLLMSVPSFTTKLRVELAKDADIDFNVAFNPGFVAANDDIQATGTKAPLPSMGPAQGGFSGGGYGPGAAMQQHAGRFRGRMAPGAAGPGGAAGTAAGGAAGAAGGAAGGAAAGAGAASGFGAPTGTPCGLVNVTECSVIKTEKLSGATAHPQRKPARGRKPAAEKKEEK